MICNTPNTSPTLENDALIVNCFYEVLFVLKLKYILCVLHGSQRTSNTLIVTIENMEFTHFNFVFKKW